MPRDVERMYRCEVLTPTGTVDHYVVAWSAEEAAEECDADDRWRDRRPIAVLRVIHRGDTVWTQPTPLTGGELVADDAPGPARGEQQETRA